MESRTKLGEFRAFAQHVQAVKQNHCAPEAVAGPKATVTRLYRSQRPRRRTLLLHTQSAPKSYADINQLNQTVSSFDHIAARNLSKLSEVRRSISCWHTDTCTQVVRTMSLLTTSLLPDIVRLQIELLHKPHKPFRRRKQHCASLSVCQCTIATWSTTKARPRQTMPTS